MSPNPQHRAIYDADGNIVLPGFAQVPRVEPTEAPEVSEDVEEEVFQEIDVALLKESTSALPNAAPVIEPTWLSDDPAWFEESKEKQEAPNPAPMKNRTEPKEALSGWETIEEEENPVLREPPLKVFTVLRAKAYDITNDALQESHRQYSTSINDGKTLLRGSLGRMHSFLTQPVWVPTRKNQSKQYGRGTLFAIDVVRFGGTFATLFLFLFLALNYQSFWEIAKANIDPLADLRMDEGKDESAVAADIFTAQTSAGARFADASGLVPTVGPPENMLVIPKLHLRVPIVNPANDSLLKEDWKALEEQIQDSLQNGVVHYPGTAKPGQTGNFFLTGHSSYFPWAPGEFKSVFARLSALEVGDEYWVFYGGDKHRYVVQEKKEVKPSDVSVLDQPLRKRISTLMTCTPVGTTLRRLIVVAQEVDPSTGKALEVGEHIQNETTTTKRAEMLPI